MRGPNSPLGQKLSAWDLRPAGSEERYVRLSRLAEWQCSLSLSQLKNYLKSKQQFIILTLLEKNVHKVASNYQDDIWSLLGH